MKGNLNSIGSEQELIEQIKRERKEFGNQNYTSIFDVELKKNLSVVFLVEHILKDYFGKMVLNKCQRIRLTKTEYEMNKDQNLDFEKHTVCRSFHLEVVS